MGPVYALNLFNVSNRDEYLAYSRRSAQEVQAHGGKVVALWESKEAFDSYCGDPKLAEVHRQREDGASAYVWHVFDKLNDLRPILK